MAAVKRIANIKQKGATACLNCRQKMPANKMIDGTVWKCENCGFSHYIERDANILIIKALQKKEEMQKKSDIQEKGNDRRIRDLEKDLQETKEKLKESTKRESEWKKSAEGLARMVEDMMSAPGEKTG